VTVKELMQRVGMTQTGRALAYIKDGLEEMNMIGETHVAMDRIDIVANQRYYEFPNEMVKVVDVRCKNQGNTRDEFRSVPRTISPPTTEDADGI
jgi:hypothetical protein